MTQTSFETIVREKFDAERRLRDLGLDMEGLVRVVQAGENARAECVAYDPVTAAGMDAYRYRVRELRNYYCARGWLSDRDRGLELIYLLESSRRVITRAGDAGTGLWDGYPQPKNESVGTSTISAIEDNATLFFSANWLNVSTPTKPKFETWMLLVYREGEVLRAELSLPTETDRDDRVLGWLERIILDLADPREPTRKIAPQEFDETIEVDVTPKP